MLLKHPNSSDIAMEILCQTDEEDTCKLLVRWWNIGRCHEPMCIGIIEEINIPLSKRAEWMPFSGRVTDPLRSIIWDHPKQSQ